MPNARFCNPVFVALDTQDISRARDLGAMLKPHVGGLKIGLEFITAHGPAGVRAVAALGLPLFADVKFHDIPNTVVGATKALVGLGVSIFNIHASGGDAMMRASADAAASASPRPLVLGVTVLTSLSDDDLSAVGQMGPASTQVVRLALLAKSSGLDGVVCSPLEISQIRAACGPDFLIVAPGVRPAGSDLADQKRVMTPSEVVRAGADVLVIGRPITEAHDPVAAARAIASEIKSLR
ncbi:MAG: orotidine-5'-phosphate decarboxylase [Rhizomicrobium sp.]|jgi:orotidine-5'-phosphate decarboxylase